MTEEIMQVINENFRDVTRHGQPKCTGGRSRNSKTAKIKNMRKDKNK
jgi:hypothetical protein